MSFLGRMILRIITFVGGVLMLALAFLRWETSIAGIPASLFEQIAFVQALPGGWVPIIVYSALGLLLVMIAIGPNRLVEWRRAIATERIRVSDQGNTSEPEEPRGYVDNRSVTSHGQMGGQIAWNITNEGPQPRQISQPSGGALVRELQKHDPEQFQISWMMDAESGELGAMLQGLLEQGGWQMTMQVPGAMLAGGPPRGVIIESTVDSEAVDALASWLRQVSLNPQVNRGEPRFDILTRGFDDKPPPPVHILVGVLPR